MPLCWTGYRTRQSRRRGHGCSAFYKTGVREDGGPFVELPSGSVSMLDVRDAARLFYAQPPKLLAVRAARSVACREGRRDADHPVTRCTGCARRATGRIRTGSSRTLALLGMLIACTSRSQDRAAIAGQFWPESGDGQALTNLRRELHHLRRIPGEDDSLEITPGQLCWHARCKRRYPPLGLR
jgi:hypothetical protein